MKRTCVIAVLLVAVVVLVHLPAKAGAGDFSGTWKCGSSVIEFRGKGPHMLLKDGVESSFVIKDSEFVVTERDGTIGNHKVFWEGDKLAVEFGDVTLKYKRK